ncbi:MAG: SMC family ATPase, partial [Candidatus Zixiibacteriota bacterium]
MRLVSLEINNFRVIKKVRISFPDKVIGIIGPNGAGKSSIIEAISWALYGNQTARTGKDEIKSSFAAANDSCQVTLEFSVNDQLYKVIRRLAGRNEKAEVELYRGEMSESVGVNETRAYVGQLLGLDWRGFLSSFLARQAELNALSDLQPSKRRDHIAGMLGMERLDRAIQKVKEDGRLYKEKGSFLERQILQKETVENRIGDLQKDIEALVSPLKELRAELSETESQIKECRATLELNQKKKDDHLRLQASIEAEQKTLENLTEHSRTLQSELDQLDQSQQELAGLAEKLAEYTSVKKEYDSLIQAKSHVAVRDELLKRQKSEQEQLRRFEQNLSLLEERLSEMDSGLKKLPEDLGRQLTSEQERLEKARDEYSRLRAELESGEKQVGKLNEQLASIGKLGPDSVCERCRRPFGEDYETIKAHISEELALLSDTVSKVEAQLGKQRTSGEDLRKLVAELEKKKNDRHQLLTQQQSTVREKESAAGQLEEVRLAQQSTGKQLQEYNEVEFDSTRFEVIETRLEELERLKERH